MTDLLSNAEIERYHQEGYVVPDYVLPAKTMTELDSALEETIASNPSLRPEHLVSAHIDRLNDEGVRGHRAWLELAQRPEILDRGRTVDWTRHRSLGLSSVLQTSL